VTEAAARTSSVDAVTNAVNPIGDESRLRRFAKIAGWIAAAVALFAVLELLGVDVSGWIAGMWDSLGAVSVKYLVLAIAVSTVGTGLNALAWLFILRAGNPQAHIRYAPIFTTYAVGSALNPFLPGNLGSIVVLFMFVAIIPGSTFAGVFAGYLVQRIFFTAVGALVYVYLFVSVPGSFSVELGGLRRHPIWSALIVIGVVLLVGLVSRTFWSHLRRLWEQAKDGGAILSTPGRYLVRVAVPSLGGYLCKLTVIATFLAAFTIPVTFGSVMHVVAGNSIASSTAVTPAGAGVNEAVSVVALHDYTDAQTASAYAVAQQLVGTSWSIALAVILVLSVFGWTDGKALVKASYARAVERARSQRKHKEQPPGAAESPAQ
jgi:uncharacterized membrane protein YbhN (UPF0104 family)